MGSVSTAKYFNPKLTTEVNSKITKNILNNANKNTGELLLTISNLTQKRGATLSSNAICDLYDSKNKGIENVVNKNGEWYSGVDVRGLFYGLDNADFREELSCDIFEEEYEAPENTYTNFMAFLVSGNTDTYNTQNLVKLVLDGLRFNVYKSTISYLTAYKSHTAGKPVSEFLNSEATEFNAFTVGKSEFPLIAMQSALQFYHPNTLFNENNDLASVYDYSVTGSISYRNFYKYMTLYHDKMLKLNIATLMKNIKLFKNMDKTDSKYRSYALTIYNEMIISFKLIEAFSFWFNTYRLKLENSSVEIDSLNRNDLLSSAGFEIESLPVPVTYCTYKSLYLRNDNYEVILDGEGNPVKIPYNILGFNYNYKHRNELENSLDVVYINIHGAPPVGFNANILINQIHTFSSDIPNYKGYTDLMTTLGANYFKPVSAIENFFLPFMINYDGKYDLHYDFINEVINKYTDAFSYDFFKHRNNTNNVSGFTDYVGGSYYKAYSGKYIKDLRALESYYSSHIVGKSDKDAKSALLKIIIDMTLSNIFARYSELQGDYGIDLANLYYTYYYFFNTPSELEDSYTKRKGHNLKDYWNTDWRDEFIDVSGRHNIKGTFIDLFAPWLFRDIEYSSDRLDDLNNFDDRFKFFTFCLYGSDLSNITYTSSSGSQFNLLEDVSSDLSQNNPAFFNFIYDTFSGTEFIDERGKMLDSVFSSENSILFNSNGSFLEQFDILTLNRENKVKSFVESNWSDLYNKMTEKLRYKRQLKKDWTYELFPTYEYEGGHLNLYRLGSYNPFRFLTIQDSLITDGMFNSTAIDLVDYDDSTEHVIESRATHYVSEYHMTENAEGWNDLIKRGDTYYENNTVFASIQDYHSSFSESKIDNLINLFEVYFYSNNTDGAVDFFTYGEQTVSYKDIVKKKNNTIWGQIMDMITDFVDALVDEVNSFFAPLFDIINSVRKFAEEFLGCAYHNLTVVAPKKFKEDFITPINALYDEFAGKDEAEAEDESECWYDTGSLFEVSDSNFSGASKSHLVYSMEGLPLKISNLDNDFNTNKNGYSSKDATFFSQIAYKLFSSDCAIQKSDISLTNPGVVKIYFNIKDKGIYSYVFIDLATYKNSRFDTYKNSNYFAQKLFNNSKFKSLNNFNKSTLYLEQKLLSKIGMIPSFINAQAFYKEVSIMFSEQYSNKLGANTTGSGSYDYGAFLIPVVESEHEYGTVIDANKGYLPSYGSLNYESLRKINKRLPAMLRIVGYQVSSEEDEDDEGYFYNSFSYDSTTDRFTHSDYPNSYFVLEGNKFKCYSNCIEFKGAQVIIKDKDTYYDISKGFLRLKWALPLKYLRLLTKNQVGQFFLGFSRYGDNSYKFIQSWAEDNDCGKGCFQKLLDEYGNGAEMVGAILDGITGDYTVLAQVIYFGYTQQWGSLALLLLELAVEAYMKIHPEEADEIMPYYKAYKTMRQMYSLATSPKDSGWDKFIFGLEVLTFGLSTYADIKKEELAKELEEVAKKTEALNVQEQIKSYEEVISSDQFNKEGQYDFLYNKDYGVNSSTVNIDKLYYNRNKHPIEYYFDKIGLKDTFKTKI
jgi:hypothetical protein